MQSNNLDKNAMEERKREFLRQQSRLKMMAPDSERKAMSADAMINSLLEKSDTFKKVNSDLPSWLQKDSPLCCPYYEKMWEIVKTPSLYADTTRLSPILLTSGLHPDILGYIWNLANKTTPGLLTQQELYIVLALVALAQSGCAFNNLSIFNRVSSAPIPRLHVPFQPVVVQAPILQQFSNYSVTHGHIPVAATQGISSFNVVTENSQIVGAKNAEETKVNYKLDGEDDEFQDFQCVPSSNPAPAPTALAPTTHPPPSNISLELFDPKPTEPENFPVLKEVSTATYNVQPKTNENDFEDFTEFQSADPFDTSIVQPTQKIVPKISSFIKVSPESERKLRNLSQPESLSALPESKISSKNQVSSMPSIAVLGSSRAVGSRLANHSLGSKQEKSHHHKNTKIKSSIISPEELFPKCLPKPSPFLLKETKISSLDSDTESQKIDSEYTRKIEIPIVGSFKETSLPVEMKLSAPTSKDSGDNLFSMNEDKYGALRELEGVDDNPSSTEDFGEFLSADLSSEKAVEAWTAWNSSISDAQLETVVTTVEKESTNIPNDSFDDTIANFQTPLQQTSVTFQQTQISDVDLLGDSFDIVLSNLTTGEKSSDDFGDFVTPRIGEPSVKVTENHSIMTKSGEPFSKMAGNHSSIPGELISMPQNFSGGIFKMSEMHTNPTHMEESIKKIIQNHSEGIVKMAVTHTSTPNMGESIFKTAEAQTGTPNIGESIFKMAENQSRTSTPSLNLSRRNSWGSLDDSNSRKTSVPSIDLKMDHDPVSSRCLQCCHHLLREALEIFNNVGDKPLLLEVLESQKAIDYVNYLKIVYEIAKRIDSNGAGSPLIFRDICDLWTQLGSFIYLHGLQLKQDEDTENSVGTKTCALCKGATRDHDYEQNGRQYHFACANLWINCIDTALPFIKNSEIVPHRVAML